MRALVGIYRFGSLLRMDFAFVNEPRVGLIVGAVTYDYAEVDRASYTALVGRSNFDASHT